MPYHYRTPTTDARKELLVNTNLIHKESSERAALEAFSHGIRVLRTCWPGSVATCGCPGSWLRGPTGEWTRRPHSGRDVGKAPFGKGGHTNAAGDEATVRLLWRTMPLANVGGVLGVGLNGQPGIAVIDADSDEAVAEARARGLPESPVRRSRWPAFLFALPPGAPQARATHTGRSGTLDILATGYVILAGRHATGAKVATEWGRWADPSLPLPTLPDWALSSLGEPRGWTDGTGQPVSGPPTPLHDSQVVYRLRRQADRRTGEFHARSLWDTGAEQEIAKLHPGKPPASFRYYSESERDLALMNYLRFWAGRDYHRLIRLYSLSYPGSLPRWTERASYRDSVTYKAMAGGQA